MNAPSNYRRTPLPRSLRARPGLTLLCWMLLIFSPFIGFALHGKVDEPGLETGLKLGILPLIGLAVLAARRWQAWKQLPAHLAEEWQSGRRIPAAGAPAMAAPIRFSHEKDWIEMRAEGVVLSRHALLRFESVPDPLEKTWVVEQAGQMFVPWRDISEWAVEQDLDGPDPYRLDLPDGAHLLVRRFLPSAASETRLLDAVRSIGKLPVRLRCDVKD